MLTISQEQLDVMGEIRLPKFFQSLVEYVEKEFPDFQEQHQVDLTSWVTTTYFKAKTYGVCSEKNHLKYINYCCIFGDDFDQEYGFAKEILTSDKTPNSKMAELKNAFVYELNKED